MNQPIAKLNLTSLDTIAGEIIPQRGRSPIANYSDFLGMKNYAMARLLTETQARSLHPEIELGKGILYLELTHHPTHIGASLIQDEYRRIRPEFSLSTSLIPLQQSHIDKIANQMVTCRFTVKNGIAARLGMDTNKYKSYLPHLDDVPDGTYEIQDGKAYKLMFPQIPLLGVFTNGVTKELSGDHPLYRHDPERIQLLYNLGIEFLNQYLPSSKHNYLAPSRYAYFKNNDLYLMNGPILTKEDPILIEFNKNELEKKYISTTVRPYHPFADNGVPSLEEIKKNGVQVPEKMYLVLGDNHAMSADSRHFGFVPENNLKGGVSFLFSPPGQRWGRAPQPEISYTTLPNLTIWSTFIAISIASTVYYRRKVKKPLRFDS